MMGAPQSTASHHGAERIIKQEIGELPLSQLSQADLNGLVSSLDDDDTDLFDHLTGPAFEIDAILDGIVDDNPTHSANGGSAGANNNNGGGGQGIVSSSQAYGTNAQTQQQQTQQQQHQQQHQSQTMQQQQQYMNYANGASMSQLHQQHHHHNQALDVDQRNGMAGHAANNNNNRRRKKLMKLPDLHGPMETVSLEEAAGNILPLANLAQQSQRKSILQSQLCDAHASMDTAMRNGKANIAAANPLLAGKKKILN